MNSKQFGAWGEELAKNYLLKMGYKIIAQNFRLGHLELDLITKKNNSFTFFEVKTRLIKTLTNEDNYLSQKQIINLKKAAATYAALNKLSFQNLNFGLIVITTSNKQDATLHLYRDIF